MLLFVVAAAGLAGEHTAVQALALAVDQELEGLQAADAQRVGQLLLGAQQLPLRALLLNLGLQVAAGGGGDTVTHMRTGWLHDCWLTD